MNVALAALAVLAVMNPVRLALASPAGPARKRRALVQSGLGVIGAGLFLAWVSGPVLNALSLGPPSAAIAAGIATLVIGVRDAVVAPPRPVATDRWAALVPLFFPTSFSPALALIAVAVGANEGVAVATGVVMFGSVAASALSMAVGHDDVGRLQRPVASAVGIAAVGLGVLMAVGGITTI